MLVKLKQSSICLSTGYALAILSLHPLSSYADTYAGWLNQIGVTDSIMSASNWGRGLTLGVVDTGIQPGNPAFATGQVSSALSSCAAVSFRCANGFLDDNGHGTAVAEIAAGNKKFAFNSNYGGYKVTANSFISVAPNANIIAEKVLNAQGSGYSTDVASGIKKAADAGASVINVSITYGNTADLVSAINYAASKGAMIVWAGGNSAQNLLNGLSTSGLTPAAISRLIFAGSVNSANARSSFSNTPGSGKLINTQGASTGYANRWIMAPGEAILAPYSPGGNNAWNYWSGTSMSAPIVSGSLILLESTWPILKTNGTAANLLLATATDLGAKGVDNTFGNGLLSLVTAFQPYGPLTVTGSNGKSIAVSSLSGSLISSGALGSLPSVQSKLSNYTSYDGFSRNFSVNLSSLIASPRATASLNALPTNANKGPAVIKLADGAQLGYWQAEETLQNYQPALRKDSDSATQRQLGFVIYRMADGTQISSGYGYMPQYAHHKVLYDNEEVALMSLEFDQVDLNSIAQGGLMASYGATLGEQDRLVASWNTTAAKNPLEPQLMPEASKWGVGWSHMFNKQWSAAVSYSKLAEEKGFLGSVASESSGLTMSESAETQSLDFTTAYRVNAQTTFMAQMSFATTSDLTGNGLFAGIHALQSQAFGMTLLSKEVFNRHDRLSLTLKQPLRVSSGEVSLLMSDVDEFGNAVYRTENVSLVPDGREIDYKMHYELPVKTNHDLTLQAIYRQDAANISGNTQFGIGSTYTIKF